VPRVAGIDPGTLSLDVCGLHDGRLVLDETWPTADLLRDPEPLLQALAEIGPIDLAVGPSGYGLPLRPAREVGEEELRLAFLAPPGESGGIGGLRALARQLDAAGVPLWFTPGVIHLDTVPPHRKLNRVDLGTADKVCATALAVADQAARHGRAPGEVSLVLLELGGAFTAGVAVERGRIVDGIGGSSGPIGWRAAGALDAEVAFLAGEVTKAMLFGGGVDAIITRDASFATTARDAYVEGAVRAARQLCQSAPAGEEIYLSGRLASEASVRDRIAAALADVGQILPLAGFAARAKQGAQGAALLADGLAGGARRDLVESLRIREATWTVLDHLYVISPADARRRLGLGNG
jgi:predicted butyrate kinase (DUF1464 family)